MVTVNELLVDHLERTFEKEAWQPSLAMAVAGLTATQAAWKPAPQRHSIWQIVRHIIHWKRAVLDGWEGTPPDHAALEKMDWGEVPGDEAAWQADVRTLHTLSQQLKERVQRTDETALSTPISTFQGVPPQRLAIRVARMATHDSYHAGQIRYIRALQGV